MFKIIHSVSFLLTSMQLALSVEFGTVSLLSCSSENSSDIDGSNLTKLTIPASLSSINLPISFKLIDSALDCPDGTMEITLGPDSKISPDGILEGLHLTAGYNYPDQYCIQSVSDSDRVQVTACIVHCRNPRTPCVEKCCARDEVFELRDTVHVCVSHGDVHRPWRPVLHYFANASHPPVPLSAVEHGQFRPHFIKKLPDSCHSYLPFPATEKAAVSDDEFLQHIRILRDGTLIVKSPDGNWEEYPAEYGEVCVDSLPGDEHGLVFLSLICEAGIEQIYGDIQRSMGIRGTISQVHAVLMLLCSIFLIGTMSIYILLWEKQNIHGWTVLSYVLSLFCMYTSLATDKLLVTSGMSRLSVRSTGCWATGILAHFAFLGTFTWLTCINFDIWWKFRDMKPNPMKSKEILRFVCYAIFAFGLPLLIIVVGLALESEYTSHDGLILTPNYGGELSCFLQKKAQGVYVYYPIGALMVLNFVFFSSTACAIFRHYRATENIHEKKSEQQRESFKMIAKLSIVMGTTWSFELLSFIFDPEETDSAGSIVWSILDCVNILQALGIFYIFVWKRQILSQLWQKYPSFRPFLSYLKPCPGCKRSRSELQSSSKLTMKSRKSLQRSQSRKPSITSTFETVDL